MGKLDQADHKAIQGRIMSDRPVNVSIIIVSWNCSRYICDCLNSIYDHTRNNTFEIIVIDNGSSDGTPDLVRNRFPGVRLVETGANLGFARATNTGIRMSHGDYLFFLNPDTLLKSDVISELVLFLETHPDGGVAGPGMRGRDNSITFLNVRELPSLSGTFFTQFGLRKLFPHSSLFAREAIPGWDRQSDREVSFISGAALMFPRPVLQEIGLLDEQLPMYFEDLDICKRVRESGRKIYYVSSATLQHMEGMCSDLSPVKSLLYAMELGHAQWLFFKKYQGDIKASIFVFVIFSGSILRLALLTTLRLFKPFLGRDANARIRLCMAKSLSLLCWSVAGKNSFRENIAKYFAIEPNYNGGNAFREERLSLTTSGPIMKISVLVHNINRDSALDRCLSSIAALTYRPLEVVILDAGSTDNSQNVIDSAATLMRQKGIDVTFVSCPLLGVAASRNLAVRYASGELLCFIDNDAVFAGPDSLQPLVRAFTADQQIALASFRILHRDSSEVDPSAWVYRRPRETWSDRTFMTFTFTGGGFCTRAAVFREAGGFWNHLRYSREEEELAMALIDKGWKIQYLPAVTIRHFPESKGRSGIAERRHVELLNGILVLWKRFPIVLAVLGIGARICTMTLKTLVSEKHPVRDLLRAVPEAARQWRDAGLTREPISLRATVKYTLLHFQGRSNETV